MLILKAPVFFQHILQAIEKSEKCTKNYSNQISNHIDQQAKTGPLTENELLSFALTWSIWSIKKHDKIPLAVSINNLKSILEIGGNKLFNHPLEGSTPCYQHDSTWVTQVFASLLQGSKSSIFSRQHKKNNYIEYATNISAVLLPHLSPYAFELAQLQLNNVSCTHPHRVTISNFFREMHTQWIQIKKDKEERNKLLNQEIGNCSNIVGEYLDQDQAGYGYHSAVHSLVKKGIGEQQKAFSPDKIMPNINRPAKIISEYLGEDHVLGLQPSWISFTSSSSYYSSSPYSSSSSSSFNFK